MHGLAHEINTPLSVVITNLSVLSRTTESLANIARLAEQALPVLVADPVSAALVAPLEAAVQSADLALRFQICRIYCANRLQRRAELLTWFAA